MAVAFLLVIVLLLGCAAWVDHRDRRAGRRCRSSGEMLSERHERNSMLRSTPLHGLPVQRPPGGEDEPRESRR